MIRELPLTVLCVALLVGATGCETRLLVQVDTAAAEGVSFDELHRFAISHQSATRQRQAQLSALAGGAMRDFADRNRFVPEDEQPPMVVGFDEPELINELAAVTRRVMDDRGWQNDAKDPQFVVSIDATYGRFDFLVPARIDTNPEAQGTAVDTGALGGRPVPVGLGAPPEDGRPASTWVHAIAAYIYDAKQPTSEPIWVGRIVTVAGIEQFHRIAPFMLDELFSEFPRTTSRPPMRTISLGAE